MVDAVAQKGRVEAQTVGTGSIINELPEHIASGLQAHPALVINAGAHLVAREALDRVRLDPEVSLVRRYRVGRVQGCPPAFVTKLQFLQSTFESLFITHHFKPDICDPEPCHDIESVWKPSSKNRVPVSCINCKHGSLNSSITMNLTDDNANGLIFVHRSFQASRDCFLQGPVFFETQGSV